MGRSHPPMGPERMVQKALRHIVENREEGDLLMDVPPSMTWSELQALTADRVGWRRRVHRLRYGPRVEVIMNNSLPGCKAPLSSNANKPPVAVAPKPPISSSARKYIVRDAHEAFFRPRGKDKRKSPLRQVAKKKRTKNVPLTNKQRQAWAREHFDLHHGAKSHDTTSWESAAPIPSDLDMTMINNPPPTPIFTPPTKGPLQILGHHNHIDYSPNSTLPITPSGRDDMLQYWEDQSQDHDNLLKISMFDL